MAATVWGRYLKWPRHGTTAVHCTGVAIQRLNTRTQVDALTRYYDEHTARQHWLDTEGKKPEVRA